MASVLRFRNAPSLAVSDLSGARRVALEEVGAAVGTVYRSIAQVSGKRTVVDSSKLALFAVAAERFGAVDLRVVHMVRDPRAVAYSWTRAHQLPYFPGRSLPTRSSARSALDWMLANSEAAVLKHRVPSHVVVRYEDLVADPRDELRRVVRTLDLVEDPDALFDDGAVLRDAPGHAIGGNPMRSNRGAVPVALDDEWRTEAPRRDRALVGALTLPMRLRYGRPSRVPAS